jgi:hypothetical protein
MNPANGHGSHPTTPRVPGDPTTGRDGRRGVWLVLGMAAVAGTLFLGLRLAQNSWKADYQEKRTYGDTLVDQAFEPIRDKRPESLEPGVWDTLVEDTQAMLHQVIGSGLLDRPRIDTLADELRGRVNAATSETAFLELAHLWRDMEQRAGPSLTRLRIPPPIELAMVLNPLDRKTPPGLTTEEWATAVDSARGQLLAIWNAPCWHSIDRGGWMQQWGERFLRVPPEQAPAALDELQAELKRLAARSSLRLNTGPPE